MRLITLILRRAVPMGLLCAWGSIISFQASECSADQETSLPNVRGNHPDADASRRPMR